MTKFSKTSICIAATSVALFTNLANAQSLPKQSSPNEGGRVGIAAIQTTKYQGSDESRSLAFPSIDYEWSNGWFAGTTTGIGKKWGASDGLQYGAKLLYDFGREESNSTALRGLGNIDPSVDFAVFAQYAIGNGFSGKTLLRYGSGVENEGALLELGLNYSTSLSDKMRFGAGIGTTFANANYLQSHFGVTNKQSLASGYKVYTPTAGIRDATVNVSLTYLLSPKIALTGVLANKTLMGDAKDGPMVKKTNSSDAILAVTYAF
jgi:outer membrane protein